MNQQLLHRLQAQHKQATKAFAVLLDPDKVDLAGLEGLVARAQACRVDYFFVGGSLITGYMLSELVLRLRQLCQLPIILFPGSNLHLDFEADAVLLLSLISGRNPELLIGQHVVAAPILKKSKLEVLATGYMLVDGGNATTVSYISNTSPIPADKPAIAACTAMAGEMLGLKLIYLDAGSGAINAVPPRMVNAVRRAVDVPVIVGGGIRSVHAAQQAWQAGADVVVVGNGIEDDASLMTIISAERDRLNQLTANAAEAVNGTPTPLHQQAKAN